ncbi:MAG TPA: alpha/beta hydrolase, partial [Pirellulales bacterium]|nr:alpha/beta hydrolase [Pirellulales bacterium]
TEASGSAAGGKAAVGAATMHLQTPAEARAAMLAQTAGLGTPEQVARIEDLSVPGKHGGIPVRVYTPEGQGPFTGLVYFHGGGWVIGSIDTHDALCRSIANAAGCVVVSVEYRLAPEHPYPAASEDAYSATCWVAEHAARLGIDPLRLAVGGDSADGYLLTRDAMAWFWRQYLPDGVSPDGPYNFAAARRRSLRPAAGLGDHGGVRSAVRRGAGLRRAAEGGRRRGRRDLLSRHDPRLYPPPPPAPPRPQGAGGIGVVFTLAMPVTAATTKGSWPICRSP